MTIILAIIVRSQYKPSFTGSVEGRSAAVEGTDRRLPGQSAGWPRGSAGPAGETVRRPGADGEFAEGQPAAPQPGESPDRLWTRAGRSAHPGHHAENG